MYVVGARGATGLELTVASEVFEESGRSLVRGTLDYLQGLKVRVYEITLVVVIHSCFLAVLGMMFPVQVHAVFEAQS